MPSIQSVLGSMHSYLVLLLAEFDASLHSECEPILYPPPQPPLSTDILTSVALTATNHTEDQPVHLRLPPGNAARSEHIKKNVGEYGGLLGRACPAAVYEYVEDDGEAGTEKFGGYQGTKFVINSQVSAQEGAS